MISNETQPKKSKDPQLLGIAEANIQDILNSRYYLHRMPELTDEQITIVFKKMTNSYYDQEIPDRKWLDWLGQFLRKYGERTVVDKTLGNSLSLVLLNCWTHYFVYQNNEQMIEECFKKISQYLGNDTTPADLTLAAISLNNQAVFQLLKDNHLVAYRKALSLLKLQEERFQWLNKNQQAEKDQEKSQILENETSVLVNTYLVICHSLNLYLKHRSERDRDYYEYQRKLAIYHGRGSKIASRWLGKDSLLTRVFDRIPTITIQQEIQITRCASKGKELTEDLTTEIQNNLNLSFLKEIESKIEYMAVVIGKEIAEPQRMQIVEPQRINDISAIERKPSLSSINPSNKQLIKQINSFDDIPLPSISPPIAPSPVYSAVSPVEFPTPKKRVEAPPPEPVTISIQKALIPQQVPAKTPNTPDTPKTPKMEYKIPQKATEVITQRVTQTDIASNSIIPITEKIEKNEKTEKSEKNEEYEKPKWLEILSHEVVPGITLTTRLYQHSKQLELVLNNEEKEFASLMLSEEEVKRFATRKFAAPYPLDSSNVTLEEIITFYILPYCAIQSLKLVFLTLPKSSIPLQSVEFLGESMTVRACFVQLNQFRVILSPENEEQQDSENSKYFTYQLRLSEEEADDKISNYVKSMSTHPRVNNLMNKYYKFKTTNDIVLHPRDSPKFEEKKLQKFVAQILQSVSLLQQFIRKEKLEDIKDALYIYNIDTFNERSHISAVYEEESKFILRLENHLKFHQRMVKLSCRVEYTRSQLREQLGDFLTSPSVGERLYLKTILCDRFRLRKIRKDFAEEDYRLYSTSPLDKAIHFLQIGFRRIIVYEPNNQYYILTISLVCNLENNPLGVKINLYNPDKSVVQNVFLPLSKYLWTKERKLSQNPQSKLRMTDVEKRRLKKKLFLNEFPVVTNYNISHALSKGGFIQILEKLNISGERIEPGDTQCSRLENNLLDNFV